MQHAQNVNSNFSTSFGSWLRIAQQHNPLQVVANIRRVALQSFANGDKNLDVNKLVPGMNATSIEHAKVNSRLTFP